MLSACRGRPRPPDPPTPRPLPVSPPFVSASSGCTGTTTISCNLGSLAPNASNFVTITAKVLTSPTGSPIVNSNYGVSSTQTDFVSGHPVTTIASNELALVIGQTFDDLNGTG